MMVVVNSKNVTEIDACIECVLVVSGADEVTDADGIDVREKVVHDIEMLWGVGAVARMVLSSDNDDRWFSNSACGCCGVQMAGDRMMAVVLPA